MKFMACLYLALCSLCSFAFLVCLLFDCGSASYLLSISMTTGIIAVILACTDTILKKMPEKEAMQ